MILGDLAHLPSAAPDAEEFRDKIQAAEEAAKDVPRGTDEPLAPAPLLTPVGSKFPVGTKVRDMLSGQTGVVVEAPGGEGLDWGGVVFVKLDADGATHPASGDFLEEVPTAPPVAPMVTPPSAPAMDVLPAPGPTGAEPAAEGSPAPGSPIPAKTPKTTNAALFRRRMNARLVNPDRPAAPSSQVKVTAAADHDDPVITRPRDPRRLRYSEMLAKLKAKPEPTHNDALSMVGYVPANWDQLVARLLGDGVVLRSKKEKFDVTAMIKAKFMETEIRYILGCRGVPMYALDQAFKTIKGSLPPKAKRPYTAGDIKAFRALYDLGAEFTDDLVLDEMHQFEATELPVGFAAEMPSVPMPTDDPGAGMAWAWNNETKKWYKTPKAG